MRGLAQPIRILLAYLKVDFTDVIYEQGDAPDYSLASWLDVKDSLGLQFPNLPYYVDGDVRLTGHLAIFKYIANRYDSRLLGESHEAMGEVEMMAHTLTELMKQASLPCYIEGVDQDEFASNLLSSISAVANFLDSKSFLTGEQLTYPDYMLFELCERI